MGKIIYLKRNYSREELKQIAEKALDEASLDGEEEKVLRMRQGWKKGEKGILGQEIESEVIKTILKGMEIEYLEKLGYKKEKRE